MSEWLKAFTEANDVEKRRLVSALQAEHDRILSSLEANVEAMAVVKHEAMR
jgi:hypothetical protein